MSLTQHFQRADFKTLPEAMTECKKGCDADATCRYATLVSASSGPKTCEFYGSGCENNIMELTGSHLYMKQSSQTITRRKRQNQIEGRYYRIYNISTTPRLQIKRLSQNTSINKISKLQEQTLQDQKSQGQ